MSQLPTKIVAATDFSPASEQALDYAVALAKKLNLELIVVHAYELPIVGFPEGVLIATAEVANQIITSAQLCLDQSVSRRRDLHPMMRAVLRNGDVRDEILSVAKQEGANLIVMGTHGRRGIRRALMGSVAEAIVRTAECPVITVRMKEES